MEKYFGELADPKKPVRASGLLNLSGLSKEEVTAFQQWWPDLPLERRRQIIEMLIDIAEDNCEADFQASFRCCLDDSDPHVRIKAIDGLWECEERWLMERLTSLAKIDPNEGVQAAATSALGKFALLGELGDLSPRDLDKVRETLISMIDNLEKPIDVRRRAIEAISPLSDPHVNDIIREAYHSNVPKLRISAVYAMGIHCDDGWLPALLAELKSLDPEMRYEAARACGQLEDERAVPHLVALTKDDDAQIQVTAIESLGHIGGLEAQRVLRRLSASPDEKVKDAALAALEEIANGEDPLRFSY